LYFKVKLLFSAEKGSGDDGYTDIKKKFGQPKLAKLKKARGIRKPDINIKQFKIQSYD